ncbi:hypothetical protein [Okeania sp.]|uniref:hypothetical protein n=1 Tax=Okeania sp. TaxID=3100323 RepID=UPI002B4B84B2|nr:hypothetical protein [Okeania sp.]MEB3340053.1 hypothetical protein [Okeania sp.]
MTGNINALQVTNNSNNNINSPTPLGVLLPGTPLTVLGTINDFDPVDFYRVTVNTPLTSGIALQNLTGDIDVAVLDNNGNLIAYGDNLGASNEAFQAPFSTPGEYLINVYQTVPGIASEYQLGLFPPSAPVNVNTIDNSNDNINTPTVLGPLVPQAAPTSVSGIINNLDGVDYYRVTVDQPLISGIALQNLTGNIDVAVLDSNANLIARGDNLDASNEAFQAAFSTPGEYSIVVYQTAPEISSNYDLTLFPGDAIETTTITTSQPASITIQGDIVNNDERVRSSDRFFANNSDTTVVRKHDYLLKATFNTPITIEMIANNTGDPFLEVFELPQDDNDPLLNPQDQQIPIAANDNGGGGLNAKIGPGVQSDSLGISSELTLSPNVDYVLRLTYNEQPFNASYTLNASVDNGFISLDRVFLGNPAGSPVIGGDTSITDLSI